MTRPAGWQGAIAFIAALGACQGVVMQSVALEAVEVDQNVQSAPPAPQNANEPGLTDSLPVSPAPDLPGVAVIGRAQALDPCNPFALQFGRPGVTIGVRFEGTELSVTVRNLVPGLTGRMNIRLDDVALPIIEVAGGPPVQFTLATGLIPGPHTLWLMHRNESYGTGTLQILAVDPGETGKLLSAPPVPRRYIEVIGASADTGYGVESPTVGMCDGAVTENPELAWLPLVATALAAQPLNSAISGMGLVLDRGPGRSFRARDTWPRIDPAVDTVLWDPAKIQASAVFIDATENDWNYFGINPKSGLEGLADPDFAQRWKTAALALIEQIIAAYPQARIYFLINIGQPQAHRPALRTLLSDTIAAGKAAGNPNLAFFEHPFDPNGVAACDSHPNPTGHQMMADQVIEILKTDLGWSLAP